ncbi:MAG: DUF6798 domain-containing protein [Chitinophagales bacterium]
MTSSILSLKNILYLLLLYVALLACWGYEYGSGDHVQIIPMLLAEKDSSLYQNDFYVQSTQTDNITERTFQLLLLKLFFDEQGWWVFILHSIFSLLLLSALWRISNFILQDEKLTWIVLLILCFPLMYHSLGSVELYNAGFTPGEAFAAWGIYYWLQRKLIAAYLFISLSALLHPIIGLHIFLLVTATEIYLLFFNKKYDTKPRKLILPVLMFLCSAGIYISLLKIRLNDTAITNTDFFNLFFSFRNAHHYIPDTFSNIDWLIHAPLYLLAPVVFFRSNKFLFCFSLLTIIGCVIYYIAVEQFHSVLFASLQWFKATIWLEFFSIVAILLLLKKYLFFKGLRNLLLSATLVGCVLWAIFVFPGISVIKNSTDYEFPFYTKTTAAIDISRQAKLKTPKDALFLQPCSFSELKFYGQRGTYVEFKALTHKKSFLKEWGERFEKVYNIQIEAGKNGFEACRASDAYFKTLTDADVAELKSETNADHLITYASCKLSFQVIAQNDIYVIYNLE